MREELMEVARSNNFIIKYVMFEATLTRNCLCWHDKSDSPRNPKPLDSCRYDKFDWNLHLTKACSEASRQPQRLITNHSPANRQGGDPSPTTLGANQVCVFTRFDGCFVEGFGVGIQFRSKLPGVMRISMGPSLSEVRKRISPLVGTGRWLERAVGAALHIASSLLLTA
jgi:hypothetical protein